MEDPDICTGEPGAESSGDWRSELLPDSRQRHVDTITETLKRHLPVSGDEALNELKKNAERFEEKIYTAATSQSDYLKKISLKMLTMETKFQDSPMGDSLLSNSMVPSNKPLDSTSESKQSEVLNEGQSMAVSMSSNQPQSHQQLLSAQISSSLPPSAVSPVTGLASASMPNIVGQNRTMQNVSGVPQNSVGNSMGLRVPSNVFSNSQRPIVSQQQQQQAQNQQRQLFLQQQLQLQQQIMKQKLQAESVPHQLMQSHMSQQQPNLMPPNQLQSSQQPVLRTPSAMQPLLSNLQQNQQSPIQQPTQSMLQHPVLHQQPTMPQQTSLPTQLMAPLRNLSNLQQQQLGPQTSLDSTAQTGQANGGDWQEEIYQKIKAMKDLYFIELREMYQKILPKLNQFDRNPLQPKSEQLNKLREFKRILERLLLFLQVQKSSIVMGLKDKISHYERQIVSFLNSNRPRNSVSTLQAGQLPALHMQSLQQSQPQMTRFQFPKNEINSLLHSANMQGSVAPVQRNNMNNMQHNSLPTFSGSVPQQNMMISKQPGSSLESGQGNSLCSLQQVAVVESLQQNSANNSSLPSQNGVNALQQNISSLQSTSNMLQHQHLQQQDLQQLLLSQQQQLKQKLQSQRHQPKQQWHQRHNHVLKQQLMQQQQPQSVVSMTDMITGSAAGNGSIAAVLEDLDARTEGRLLARNSVSPDGPNGTKKMRHYMSAMPLNVVSSAGSVDAVFKPLTGAGTSDLESTATSSVKRTRVEAQDWRSQLQPESRQQIIDKIMEILEKHLPVVGHEGLIELRKMVETFENEIYITAVNQILQSLKIED